MNKTIGLVVLILGIVFLVWGFNASDSAASDVSRFFNGAPTDKAILLLVIGGALTIFGGLNVLRGGQR